MNQMEVSFREERCPRGIYMYNMKIENNICTWSSSRMDEEFPNIMYVNFPPYNVPSYIPNSIKELIMLIGKSTNHFYANSSANEMKRILTVTLKDDLDDIILHNVKELKETKNKLKETENKLKETENKLKETENKLKELYDKQKKD